MKFDALLSESKKADPTLKGIVGLTAFWMAAFILNAGPHWDVYSSDRELIETAGLITLLQLLVAIVALKILVPKYLNTGRWVYFTVGMFLVLVAAAEINIVVRYLYLEPTYSASYAKFLSAFGDMSLLQRMNLGWSLRYIIFSKVPIFILPTTLLLAYHYYEEQQNLLAMREQKRTAELNALKNQLNPHFIFNTLNNIYALALKKSDQAPEAIAKLSAMLDYVVYRCNQQYVSFDAELKMLDDFIALEKLRYGDRLSVVVDNQVNTHIQLPPLLILTLVENACKHSARDELGQATVQVNFSESLGTLSVRVSNSKNESPLNDDSEGSRVGLQNLRAQLDLLYPTKHSFTVEESETRYSVELMIDTNFEIRL